MSHTYKLEDLFTDQDPAYVVEVLPATLAWIDPSGSATSCTYTLRIPSSGGTPNDAPFIVTWDVTAIAAKDQRVIDDASRMRRGKTLLLEDIPKLAAYGLAMAAISYFIKKRVVDVSKWEAPDLLLDATATKVRGVEVAGRSSKGYAAFRQALDDTPAGPKTAAKVGKRNRQKQRADLVEGYLSLWCQVPAVAWWERAKP